MVVQILTRILTASWRDHAGTAHETVNQECYLVCIRSESFQNVVGPRARLVVVVGGNVCREQFRVASFVHCALHRVVNQWNYFLHRAEYLVALWLIVLDEVATQPELICRFGERLRTQTQLRLDDRAGDITTVFDWAAENAPHVGDIDRGTIELHQHFGWNVEILHLRMLDVAHALIVTDRT